MVIIAAFLLDLSFVNAVSFNEESSSFIIIECSIDVIFECLHMIRWKKITKVMYYVFYTFHTWFSGQTFLIFRNLSQEPGSLVPNVFSNSAYYEWDLKMPKNFWSSLGIPFLVNEKIEISYQIAIWICKIEYNKFSFACLRSLRISLQSYQN